MTASARTLAWVERLAWILIYGGLFGVILGAVTGNVHIVAGWSFGVLGGIAVVAGVVLIWLRSRMQQSPDGSAQSSIAQGQGQARK